MGENKNDGGTTINIYGGTTQINPAATEATQIFYGDQFAPQELRKQPSATPEVTSPTAAAPQPIQNERAEDVKRAMAIGRLKMHITDNERLDTYLEQLSICETATNLARVIVTMRSNEGWPDEVEIVKERFINDMKVLAPRLTKGNTVSNIRARIKAGL